MFKFENKWLHEEGLPDVVKDSWYRVDSDFFIDKVASCFDRLAAWGRDLALKFRRKVQNCKKDLKLYRKRTDVFGVGKFEELKT